jgi:sugar/nucleoside kinase (ribokinase family)
VLGDLMLDVVLAPARPLEPGTDVPGRVTLVQGGSAATTARWLGRLGARTSLIAAVGRDAAGRALVEAIRSDGVAPQVSRVAGARTGRVGVFVEPGGERSFVADRGAAGASVSVDLASIGPLLADGRRAARALIAGIAPDVLFATVAEAEAFLGGRGLDGLLDVATIAVVKRGPKGATVLARVGSERIRLEVATEHLAASDTTGAGDAFDAGFLVGWFAAQRAGRSMPASLQRAAVAGHRAAARQLSSPRPELPLGAATTSPRTQFLRFRSTRS